MNDPDKEPDNRDWAFILGLIVLVFMFMVINPNSRGPIIHEVEHEIHRQN